VRPLAAPPKQAAAAAAAPAAPAPAPKLAARSVEPPPVSAAPPAHGMAVQVGAFSERKAADELIAKLRGAGFSAYAAAGDAGPFRVRVGPYADRPGAERAAAKLKAEHKLPTWVLEETGVR
jgi:cell division septation protein DedD